MSSNVDKLISRIKSCIDYHSICAMEGAFNSVGLTIQSTPKNRMILCKLDKDKPKADEVGIDYIFLGDGEISERAENKIIDFVLNNAGDSGKVKDNARVWRNGLRMYEQTISIMNEDVSHIASVIEE